MSKKLYLFLLLIPACLMPIIINSCKKDSRADRQNAVSDPVVAEVKSWYESAYPTSNTKITTLATSTNTDFTQMINPDWQYAVSYKREDQPVLEIPINSSDKFTVALKNGATNDILYSKNNSRSSFLILKDGESYKAYVMTVIADPDYLKNDLTKLDHDKYNKRDTDFTGVVLYSTPKGVFISGWFYNNGSIVNTLQPKSASGGDADGLSINKLSPNLARLDCTDWYQITEGGGETRTTYLGPLCNWSNSDGSSNGGAPSGSPTSGGGKPGGSNPTQPPVKPPCTVPNSNPIKVQSTDGHLIVNYKPVKQPGDGDGTYPPPKTPPPPKPTPPPPCPTITNNVTDPCLKKMVDATINKNITTVINMLIQKVFSGSTKINVTYVDVTDLPAGENGEAPPPKSLDAYGNLNITVKLNKNTMPHYSQEYISRVIMHESLHAYLTTVGIFDKLQHEDIATMFVTQMALDLQQMYPGLSDFDAKSLALGGLQNTDAFKQTIAKDINLLGDIQATQLAYSTGTSGTRCN